MLNKFFCSGGESNSLYNCIIFCIGSVKQQKTSENTDAVDHLEKESSINPLQMRMDALIKDRVAAATFVTEQGHDSELSATLEMAWIILNYINWVVMGFILQRVHAGGFVLQWSEEDEPRNRYDVLETSSLPPWLSGRMSPSFKKTDVDVPVVKSMIAAITTGSQSSSADPQERHASPGRRYIPVALEKFSLCVGALINGLIVCATWQDINHSTVHIQGFQLLRRDMQSTGTLVQRQSCWNRGKTVNVWTECV